MDGDDDDGKGTILLLLHNNIIGNLDIMTDALLLFFN